MGDSESVSFLLCAQFAQYTIHGRHTEPTDPSQYDHHGLGQREHRLGGQHPEHGDATAGLHVRGRRSNGPER